MNNPVQYLRPVILLALLLVTPVYAAQGVIQWTNTQGTAGKIRRTDDASNTLYTYSSRDLSEQLATPQVGDIVQFEVLNTSAKHAVFIGGACVVTGCSGQVCDSKQVFTTCEFLPEYACYPQFGICSGVRSRGEYTCGWEQTRELLQCILEAQGP